jgi:hypothetical protein
MDMNTRVFRSALNAWLALGPPALAGGEYNPHIDPVDFQTTVDHPYFPLVPGTTFEFNVRHGRHTRENRVTVTHDVRVVMGVNCIVVHDVERDRGTVKEDTYDWYAQDQQDNVWYFGEDTKEYRPDGHADPKGSWEGGVHGALPGVVMRGDPAPGEPYRQEFAPDALDMGQVVSTNETVTVPFGTFTGCIKTKEWSLLEKGREFKWYAKGIGFIRAESTDGEVEELISMSGPDAPTKTDFQ